MLQIQNPFQQFFDLDGRPLDDGSIYIGSANQNPQTNLVAVFWDADGTLPAAQPIKTTNGYATRTGTPARVYTGVDDYSVTVLNKEGSVVYTAQSVLGISDLRQQLDNGTSDLVDSEVVGFGPGGVGAVRTTSEAKMRETVSVADFLPNGYVTDGTIDYTAETLAAHTYANSIGVSVSYKNLAKIALQANAQIPLKTSVDFENCELVILGGVNSPPTFSTFNDLYVVTDDDCPLVTVTGAVSASNLTVGAMFPTLGLFDGHGYALLSCGSQVPNRAETGTMDYVQSFKVNRNGRVSHPLSADISAFASAITVSYRKTSKRRLSIKNVSLTEGAWNNQRVFNIQRCNVQVDNFTLMFTGGNYDNIMNIIKIEDASDVWVNNYITTGRPVTTTLGSYCLDIEGGADIYVNGMNALTGWGATGTNNVNGVHYNKCVLNRIDTHSSGHNMFAEDCDLHESGMVYGWGGGLLSVKNSRLYRCPAIQRRGDYGGTFFGDVVVDGCEFNNNFSATLIAVDLEVSPLGAATPVYAPKTISVLNCKRTGIASSANAEFIPVRLKVKDASSVVYAPISISAHNITCHQSWRFGMRVDWLNMEANPATSLMRIEFSNVFPTSPASTTTGIIEYASIRTPAAKVQPWIVGHDAEHIHVVCTSDNNAQIIMNNVGINGVAVNNTNPPRCLLDACKFTNSATGYSSPSNLAPVGGPQVGNNVFTTVSNCEVGASNIWDFSKISAAIGNTIRGGTQTPVLPAGVTPTLFFTGWRAAGSFQS